MRRVVSFFGEHSDVFVDLNEKAEKHAAARGLQYSWLPQSPYDRDRVIAALRDADAGIIDIEQYGEELFKAIDGGARLLIRFGVGYDNVDLAAAARHGIAIARTTGANTLGVAEMALTLILATKRKIKINQKCVEAGQWKKNVARETIGSTVGILGFGAIGNALADLLKGFNCHLIAYDPFPNKEAMARKGVELVGLDDLFRRSDAISVHVPYGKETHHLVDASALSLMKPSAVIVNTSRGNIVDEEALYEALDSNRIAGAALDVFAREPLPSSSPLLRLDNLVLTPHVSSQTVESLWRIYETAIDIAADFFEGVDSPHILNPDYKIRARV